MCILSYFSTNTYNSYDDTFKTLNNLRKNQSIIILDGDKDSSVVIMNKVDYIDKMEQMLNEGIEKGVYAKSKDSILSDLDHFQDFLYRNFSKYK